MFSSFKRVILGLSAIISLFLISFHKTISLQLTLLTKDLFTSIPLNHLKDVLTSYFNDYNRLLDVDINFWNKLINFCIFNNYIYNGEQLFLQVTGIPQGSTYSSILANLFLHWFEKNYNLLNFTAFRFIDDIIIFNYEEFNNLWQEIYPKELILKKTNNSFSTSTQFLDINIVLSETTSTTIYDKRNDFPFHVNKITPWSSNISIKIHRNILINQLNRIDSICNNTSDKENLLNVFENNLQCNNFPIRFIKKYLHH